MGFHLQVPNMEINGVNIPRFLYGTAWKEDRTRALVELAIAEGFRGIDTANQRKHYFEAAAGEAVAAAIQNGIVKRADLFLQTKFTFRGGQDHRLPYDSAAPVAMQVEQSLTSSLEHLQTDVIDCYVLHGPTQWSGLGADDWAAWRAMESLHDSGRVRLLGVSNVNLSQLEALVREARARPTFVQNRCFAEQGWDRDIRGFCAANSMAYQGFSLLTANRKALANPEMAHIAARHNRTIAQVVFRFALEVGMMPLTGTSDPAHMREDLAAFDFQLDPNEIEQIERIAI